MNVCITSCLIIDMHSQKIDIHLAKFAKPLHLYQPLKKDEENEAQKVVPGSIVTHHTDLMRGHGTYLDETNLEKILRSSLIGTVSCVNKLITVNPRNSRYNGEVGDVVVGQILEVGKKRWKIDVHANQDAILPLSYVDLPFGEIAQVYSRYSDGSVSLSVRGDKFGKLGQGTLVKVSPSLVKQNKIHFHSMTCGISVIIGSNGYVWIAPSHQHIADNDPQHLERQFSEEEYIKVSRMKACIIALSGTNTPIYDMTMLYAYEASLSHEVSHLQKPEVIYEVINTTREMYSENSK